MSRPRPKRSLFGPMAFAFCGFVFAAGAGYTWWLDHRAPVKTQAVAPAPLREVRAAMPSAFDMPRPAAGATPIRAATPSPAAMVRKCLGADGVPVFTSTACPQGTTLEREIAIELPRDSPAVASHAGAAVVVANAQATVVNQAPGYDIPSRDFRRDVDHERAWDRCERGKVRAEAEVAALRNRRTMSQIRKWESYAVQECATYEVMAR